MYNLRDDLSETNNLADAMPDKTRELHRLLVDWRKSVNAPVPTEKNPKYDPAAMTKRKKKKRTSKNRQ